QPVAMFFSAAYFAAASLTMGAITLSSLTYQSDAICQFLPSQVWMRPVRAPSWSAHDTLTGLSTSSKPSSLKRSALMSRLVAGFLDMYARVRVMGSYISNGMPAHKHGICSMTTVVHCTRTGRGCSEPTCQDRHWCRKMFERGLSHRGLPLKRKFRP